MARKPENKVSLIGAKREREEKEAETRSESGARGGWVESPQLCAIKTTVVSVACAAGKFPNEKWHGQKMTTQRRRSRAKHTQRSPQTPPAAYGSGGPPPVVLTGRRLELYDEIVSRYTLDPASEALLRNAAEALERAAALAEIVTTQGAVVVDRFGSVKASPAAALERDYRSLAARSLAQLAARFED